MNSLYNAHYLFKTRSTGNLNIYWWKTSFICHKLPTCTLQYMILLVKMGKRESQSTDLVRLQLRWTHARTRLWNKKYGFSLWTLKHLCFVSGYRPTHNQKYTGVRTECTALFTRSMQAHLATAIASEHWKKLYNAPTLFPGFVRPRTAVNLVHSLCFISSYPLVLNVVTNRTQIHCSSNPRIRLLGT
jgi:hypothetical protein